MYLCKNNKCMFRIYHNPRCRISRQVLSTLRNTKAPVEIIDYLKEPPTENTLKDLLDMLDMQAEDLLRKQERIFKENYKNEVFNHIEWIRVMCANPKLIDRPIVVKNNKALLCRPADRIQELLK
jgi:arsenate reductase (glutaredoxin)